MISCRRQLRDVQFQVSSLNYAETQILLGHLLKDLIQMELPIFSLLHHPSFSHDAINQSMVSNIKRRVPSPCEVRRNRNLPYLTFNSHLAIPSPLDRPAFNRRHLGGRPLFNRNLRPRRRIQIDRRPRCRHDKSNIVELGQNRKPVRADLVGRVAISGHAVGAHDDAEDVFRVPLPIQERAGHGVGDEGSGDVVVQEFVAGEAGALVVRSRFGVVDSVEDVEGAEVTDDAEGGAVACCC